MLLVRHAAPKPVHLPWGSRRVIILKTPPRDMTFALQLDVLCFELQAKGSILVPRAALVADLKREACAELFLQEDTVSVMDCTESAGLGECDCEPLGL